MSNPFPPPFLENPTFRDLPHTPYSRSCHNQLTTAAAPRIGHHPRYEASPGWSRAWDAPSAHASQVRNLSGTSCAEGTASRLVEHYRGMRQTLKGSFSAVSKRNFASKYVFESSRRDVHDALLCTGLEPLFCRKLVRVLPKKYSFFRNVAEYEITYQ